MADHRDLDLNAIKQLQRAIAGADIARDILTAGIPSGIAAEHHAAINAVVKAQKHMKAMQAEVLDRLDEGGREWVATGSRVGADHLRNLLG